MSARKSFRSVPITLGTTIIVSAVAASAFGQSPASITLRPATAVFAIEDELFTAIGSVRELSDGRVLVADILESRVANVDFAVNRALPVGATGDGPGEYRGVRWLLPLSGDSTLLIDPIARRWIILEGARSLQTVPADDALIQLLGPSLAGAERGGRLLGVVALRHSTSMPAMRENADSLGLVLASWGRTWADTVARIRGRGADGVCISVRGGPPRRPVPACNRLATEDLALLYPDGWIAIAMTEPYRVDWRSPDGRWVRGAALPFEEIRLNDRDKCTFLGAGPGLGMRASCDPSADHWPAVLPPFLAHRNPRAGAPLSPSALATPEGNLMIYRAVHPRAELSRYDLVNRNGRLVGTLTLPKEESVVGFGSESIYVAQMTELGLQKLRRHPWP